MQATPVILWDVRPTLPANASFPYILQYTLWSHERMHDRFTTLRYASLSHNIPHQSCKRSQKFTPRLIRAPNLYGDPARDRVCVCDRTALAVIISA